MINSRRLSLQLLCLVGLALCGFNVFAEDQPAKPEEKTSPVVIAEEPKSIDPATLMPEKLAAKVTVEFQDASLKEIVKWLQDNQQLSVIIDQQEITTSGGSLDESITDRLDNEPLYLLLDRFERHNFSWFFEENVLHITSTSGAQVHYVTIPYNIGHLIDAKFEADPLLETIRSCTAGEWSDVDEQGGASMLLGDVLFIRQSAKVHREIAGLLLALKQPARRTFVTEPPHHNLIREKLHQNVRLDVQGVPLSSAIRELSQQVGIKIEVDLRSLREKSIREKTPVSLKLSEQKLSVVIQALVAEWGLKAIPKEGVLWITSGESAQNHLLTAVYDVRDLCRDDSETSALQEAIFEQASGDWENDKGIGGAIQFPKHGLLTIRQTEAAQEDILQLLEKYRSALRISKPRTQKIDGPQDVLTYYYRLPKNVADDLVQTFPVIFRPETWKSESQANAPGKIIIVSSMPQTTPEGQKTISTDYSVLIITQTRENHDQLSELIQKILYGDSPLIYHGFMVGGMGGGGMGGGGMGGGGMGFDMGGKKNGRPRRGMGGFGGGMFSIPRNGNQVPSGRD